MGMTATTRINQLRAMLPPGMRERVDAAHAALNAHWVPWDERGIPPAGYSVPLEMAAPAPAETPKVDIIPAFTPPPKRPRTPRAAQRKAIDPAICQHEKWQQQGLDGTKYADYERCTRCGKGRVKGREAKARGKKPTCPKMNAAHCPHKPEWLSNVNKNGGPALKCKACLSVRISFDGSAPIRRFTR